ncbi:unnamed protein product [Orchesella dallaii]|uniref:Uncharacterized protein n=1 Tax=Orchesella dallaii TaxID=48710 RepID=A0ABP1PRT0_9HEXA
MSSSLQGGQPLLTSNINNTDGVNTNPNPNKTKSRTFGGISFEAESLPEFSEFEDSDTGDSPKQRVE